MILIVHNRAEFDSPVVGMDIVWFATDNEVDGLLDYRYWDGAGMVGGRKNDEQAWAWAIYANGGGIPLVEWKAKDWREHHPSPSVKVDG